MLKRISAFAIAIILLLTLGSLVSCENTEETSSTDSGESEVVSFPAESTPPAEVFVDAEFKYTVDRTLDAVNVALNMPCTGSVSGTDATDGKTATTASASAGKVDFTVALDGTTSGIGDFSLTLTGSELPEKIQLVISTDEIDWYSVGDIAGVESNGAKTYSVSYEKGFRARYLRVIYNAGGETAIDGVSAFIYQSTCKLYVNGIDNSMFFSPLREGEHAQLFTEGQGAIVTEKYIGTYPAPLVWNKVICCAPVGDGTYTVTAIYPLVGSGQEKYDAEIPEGGFCYCVNLGNDYPALFAADPSRKDFEGFPNYTSDEINASFALVDTVAVGDTVTLVNIDLEEGVIVDDFGSYLSIKG